MEDANTLIDTNEAAKILGISPKRVRRLQDQDVLKVPFPEPYKPGTRRWFWKTDVEAYAKECATLTGLLDQIADIEQDSADYQRKCAEKIAADAQEIESDSPHVTVAVAAKILGITLEEALGLALRGALTWSGAQDFVRRQDVRDIEKAQRSVFSFSVFGAVAVPAAFVEVGWEDQRDTGYKVASISWGPDLGKVVVEKPSTKGVRIYNVSRRDCLAYRAPIVDDGKSIGIQEAADFVGCSAEQLLEYRNDGILSEHSLPEIWNNEPIKKFVREEVEQLRNTLDCASRMTDRDGGHSWVPGFMLRPGCALWNGEVVESVSWSSGSMTAKVEGGTIFSGSRHSCFKLAASKPTEPEIKLLSFLKASEVLDVDPDRIIQWYYAGVFTCHVVNGWARIAESEALELKSALEKEEPFGPASVNLKIGDRLHRAGEVRWISWKDGICLAETSSGSTVSCCRAGWFILEGFFKDKGIDFSNDSPAQSNPKTPAEKISEACDEIKALLLRKNAAYGNSALDPLMVMSKASPAERIRVRIDDKLSRESRGDAEAKRAIEEDTALDLCGHSILLLIATREEAEKDRSENDE